MERQRSIERFLLAAHRLAMSRLREQPQRVEELRSVLRRWREQSGRSHSDRYWDEWDRLLAMPLDDLERTICANDEHAAVLRSVSPIGMLISEAERSELLRRAREAA